MSDLFTPAFVHGVQRLRLVARRVKHARQSGDHTSPQSGAGHDFRDFRPYAPGDDFRRVDWGAYRRTRRLMLRLFEEPRQVAVHILLDMSDSTFLEDPPRADAGRRVAAALSAAAAEQHDSVTIYPFGSQLHAPIRLHGGQDLPRVLDALKRLQPAGKTDTALALSQFEALRPRSGVLVLISDFFDRRGLDSIFKQLEKMRQRLVLVQLTRESDLPERLSGDLELVDCEDEVAVRLTVGAAARRAYQDAYGTFKRRIDSFAAQRHAPCVAIDADADILRQLEKLFVGGVLKL